MNGRPPVWTRLQRRLHWTVAALLLAQASLGWPMAAAVRRLERVAGGGGTPGLGDFLLSTLHTASGVAIGLLVLWRLKLRLERLTEEAPRRPWPARLVQAVLYAATLLMVVSGSLYWYAGLSAAAGWHGAGKWLLLVAVALHLAGALRHWLARDGVFQAMSKGSGYR